MTSAIREPGRLVRAAPRAESARHWGDELAPLFEDGGAAPGWQPWQVLGGPGTGKTSLLADLAVAHIRRWADPGAVMVLTHSRAAAGRMRATVSAGLLGAGVGGATREPTVRTVHSYAFAVLRAHAAAHGNPAPRLLTGSEQDAMVRELLAGELDDDAGARWPQRLRPALGMAGFAAELRDLMMRANERGIAPEGLVQLGRRYHRPEWVAAGKFAARFEQAGLLRWSVGVEAPEATAPALDAAELIAAAAGALAGDAQLLEQERARLRVILVDDAQNLDPRAAQLIRLIGTGTSATVVAGDPDQAIFGFRGADPRFLTDLDERRRVLLRVDHRCAAAISATSAGLAARLPGAALHRGATAEGSGSVAVRVLSTVAKEAAEIADHLRRAHLEDGVPWSEMAVLVRSMPASIVALRRGLTVAGVPVRTNVSELALPMQPAAAWLLLALRALDGRFDGADALALLSSPLGAADPLSLRRLRRGLRRADLAQGRDRDSADVLRELLVSRDCADSALVGRLTDVESAPLRRVTSVLAQGRAILRTGGGVEDVLWALWRGSRLEKRWVAASARGGPSGALADRDLDAVVALFDVAAQYVDRLPNSSLDGFVDHVQRQQLHGIARTGGSQAAVTICSVHAAAGREWDVVAVAGLQEGLWPSVRGRTSLLRTEDLLDLGLGIEPDSVPVSRTAPLIAEERRLLVVACSRARRSLLVTAVESVTGDRDLIPSRFVEEIGGESGATAVHTGNRRVLALPPLVAELRSVVCDPESEPSRRERAARQLARLAGAGVRGADPGDWYGLAETSTSEPMWSATDGTVTLSPSTVELLRSCPLRWALERNGGSEDANVHAVKGNLVHTLAQAVAGGVSDTHVRAALEKFWPSVDAGSGWHSRQELRRTAAMLDNFAQWLRRSRSELTQAGVEVGVDFELAGRSEGEPVVRVRGRIDRLERDPAGHPVIVDIKTGKSPVTKQAAREHPQLATYQVAAAAGGIDGEPAAEPGGGRLVYVAKSNNADGATQRTQPALDAEALDGWRDTIRDAAAATAGPHYLAVVNDGCRHCPVSGSCPARDTGGQVTDR